MIFCGDIALPFVGSIDYSSIPLSIREKTWFGNLEGSLLIDSSAYLSRKVVFNDYDAVRDLCQSFSFKGFGLANNHLLDVCSYKQTADLLSGLDDESVGAGETLEEAERPLLVEDEYGQSFAILAFGWNVIECVYASKTKEGVNPYEKEHVLFSVRKALSQYPKRKLICFFHWNYELELYPQPFDRELSEVLIDLGVYAVLGCHAHRVQQIEFYKGRPIVYGLGNFLFPQNIYWDGKLRYPVCSRKEFVFEILPDDLFFVHWLEYDSLNRKIAYDSFESMDEIKCEERVAYHMMPDLEYEKWFSENRSKKKLLPIFLSSDTCFELRLKFVWIKIRAYIVSFIKLLYKK